jgi:hypothetical protein
MGGGGDADHGGGDVPLRSGVAEQVRLRFLDS